MKRFIGLVILMSAATLSAGEREMYPGTATCFAIANSSRCEIAWDLSTSPRAYHRVERLDVNTKSWVSTNSAVSRAASDIGTRVNAGELYRVLACDDAGFNKNCQSSTATWGAVILPVEQIPATVDIAIGDGTTTTASVSKLRRDKTLNDDKMNQNIQHNVYLMYSLVSTVAESRGGSILPAMSPPVDPGAPDDLDHHIHHNVQEQYETLRNHFIDKAEGRLTSTETQ